MGLLDRMLADMVGKSVGVNPRMVRRLIRGKGGAILAMGAGAAIAGALGNKGQAPGQVTPSTMNPGMHPSTAPPPSTLPTGSPPPPPPSTLPSAAPPPPPPLALPTDAAPPLAAGAPAPADAAAEDPPTEVLYPMLRTMVAAAMADGSLDPNERQTIESHLAQSHLDGARRARIQADLGAPATTSELAGLAADAETRAAMYRIAGLVILADGRVDSRERAWLDELAAALSFDAATKAALEDEIFAAS